MTGVFISFQVTVNALNVLLQYIESDELGMMCICSLQTGSLVWVRGTLHGGPAILQGNGLRKSEPARELLIFEYPVLADAVIKLVKSDKCRQAT